MNDSFFSSVMRVGARLIFWIAIVLLFIQVVDDVAAVVTVSRMSSQEFGPSFSFIGVIPKLVESFVWPTLALGIAMIIDRLDRGTTPEDPRK